MWCRRLERLIHLELADLVVRGIYLESDFRVRRGSTGKGKQVERLSTGGGTPNKVSAVSPRRIQRVRAPCVDCESPPRSFGQEFSLPS
jgi:hypothetical protein